MSARILIFAGSIRKGSLNVKLAKACAKLVEDQAAEATYVDLKDFSLPIYNGDLEAESGVPENALKLRKMLSEHDGFLIASPEYNSSITPLLKNTIDWISRQGGIDEAFRGKVVALVSAAPGRLGGLRGLVTVRSILGNIGVHVIPNQVTIPAAREAFDDEGNLVDESAMTRLVALVKVLVETATRLKG